MLYSFRECISHTKLGLGEFDVQSPEASGFAKRPNALCTLLAPWRFPSCGFLGFCGNKSLAKSSLKFAMI